MSDHIFMLDTNILSDLAKNPRGKAQRRVRQYGINSVCISAIVASEIRFGLAWDASDRLTERVEATLERISILDYDEQASFAYAVIRRDLQRRGTPIGSTDTFIAAHARSLGLTLVTNNIREFSRVDGLKVENWLEEEDPTP